MKIIYSTVVVLNKNDKTRALNVILKGSLTYIKLTYTKDDRLSIIIRTSDVSKYKKAFYENNIDAYFSSEKGALSLMKKIKTRVGLFLGIFILFISIIISSNFVWTINIFGNEHLTDEQVVSELEKAGFSIGSFIPGINYKTLHNEILLNSSDISWISVNISGNVANVFIKETLKEEVENQNKYSNLVAKEDGQIFLISVINGQKMVSSGDVVKKGDLLISGVIDSQSQGVRYVNADGSVLAYVNKNISISVPYNDVVKVYTNVIHSTKKYKIFNKDLFFFTKYGNYDAFCDTIEKTEQIEIFDHIKLPIYRTTTRYYEFEYQNVNFSKEQAVDKAFKELRERMDKELLNVELISKKITTSYDNNYLYLNCELYCLEDIASSVEFSVKNNGG